LAGPGAGTLCVSALPGSADTLTLSY